MELRNDNNKMNHHITESPEQLRNYQIPTANLVPSGCFPGQMHVVQIILGFFLVINSVEWCYFCSHSTCIFEYIQSYCKTTP